MTDTLIKKWLKIAVLTEGTLVYLYLLSQFHHADLRSNEVFGNK